LENVNGENTPLFWLPQFDEGALTGVHVAMRHQTARPLGRTVSGPALN
jgi:hypothetical protein